MRTSNASRLITPFLLLSLATVAMTGCAVSRTTGPGRPLGSYDYCVLSRQATREYYDTASSMLDRSFVVLEESSPLLELPRVRQKACVATVDWAPGFWSTSGWVELKDYSHGTHVHTSQMRRGMLWTGANADVLEALRDVVSARAEGPPLPEDARKPVPDALPARSTAQRLQELNDLKLQGLITEKEYSARRQAILSEQ